MHSDHPLVSVVMPFLNAPAFMQETLESVFAQTYDGWELLLVDDGSTDASTAMARRYAQQYPEKVRYVEHPAHQNRGVSASRNLGVNHANGQYVALLDADDVWLSQKLRRQVATLQSHPEAAMTYGPSQWWYSWTGDPDDSMRDYLQSLGVQANTLFKPPTLLSLFLRQQTAVPVPSAVLVRREAIERIGGWEEAFPTLYEDQVFYAKVCLEAPAFVERGCYCKYRRHPASLCAAMLRTGQGRAARQTFLNWLEAYLSKQQVRNDEVWAALRQELWPYRHPLLQRISTRVSYRMRQMARFADPMARQSMLARVRYRLALSRLRQGR